MRFALQGLRCVLCTARASIIADATHRQGAPVWHVPSHVAHVPLRQCCQQRADSLSKLEVSTTIFSCSLWQGGRLALFVLLSRLLSCIALAVCPAALARCTLQMAEG
jgi:hypothetical protein